MCIQALLQCSILLPSARGRELRTMLYSLMRDSDDNDDDDDDDKNEKLMEEY